MKERNRVCCQLQEVQNCWCQEINVDVLQKSRKYHNLNWTALQISWRCKCCVTLVRISQVQNVRNLEILIVCHSSLYGFVCDFPTNKKCSCKQQLPLYQNWCSFALYFRSWRPSDGRIQVYDKTNDPSLIPDLPFHWFLSSRTNVGHKIVCRQEGSGRHTHRTAKSDVMAHSSASENLSSAHLLMEVRLTWSVVSPRVRFSTPASITGVP